MANGEAGSSSSSSRRTTPPRHTPPRSSGPGTPTGTPRHMSAKKPLPVFNSYMSLFQVQEKLKKGEVIEGVLRINPKNYEDAYISAPDGGMDIYIGGVLDRNAALHGDLVVVELYPPNQWKVLYDVLDEYLRQHPAQKSLVYRALEPTTLTTHTTTASSTTTTTTTTTPTAAATITTTTTTTTTTTITATAASRYIPEPINTSTKPRDKQGRQGMGEGLEQGDSDVLVEEEEEELGGEGPAQRKPKPSTSKKKRGGRGKKKGKRKGADALLLADCLAGEAPTEDSSVACLSGGPPGDQVLILPSNQDLALPSCDLGGGKEEEEEDGRGRGVGVVVPPDQLSECEFTDDESGSSEVLDYEQRREDQEFFQAQWEAFQRQQHPEAYPSEQADQTSTVQRTTTTHQAGQSCSQGDQDGRSASQVGTFGEEDAQGPPGLTGTGTAPSGPEVGCVYPHNDQDREVNHLAVALTGLGTQDQVAGDVIKPEGQHVVHSGGVTVTPTAGRVGRRDKQPKKRRGGGRTVNSPGAGQEQQFGININVASEGRRPKKSQPQQPQRRAGYSTPQSAKGRAKQADRRELAVEQVQQLKEWPRFVQRTGRVVYITDRRHPRLAAGTLRLFPDKNPHNALFSPADHRVPRMRVPLAQLPQDFPNRQGDYQQRIFVCKITQWTEVKYACGELYRDVGQAGDIEAETEALLLEHAVDYQEFPESVLQNLPVLPWSIPPQELAARKDLRDQCIFTIDPCGARDLDDAVSCQTLPSGNLRVGVHIADVSYFVPEGGPLDRTAASRATSVYLVEKVVPMLPRVLCEKLCSLTAGEDRLAFSVVWEMTPEGEVLSEWFGRTVIRSCVQLAYGHAQAMIEEPEREWSTGEMPEVFAPHTLREVSCTLGLMQSLALIMRRKRFEGGALRLDQPKMFFTLDQETNLPLGVSVYRVEDSHRLIEEFMLLANITAARQLYCTFPETCLLRRHPPPLGGPLEAVARTLAAAGVALNTSSAGALNASVNHWARQDHQAHGRLHVITALCSKPMQLARYFCPGILQDIAQQGHYALNVPLYTHFTSPIRRYADVIVHRMLVASLQPTPLPPPSLWPALVEEISERCNDRKKAAKTVQEASGELHLGLLLRLVGELVQEAVVVAVLDHSFDVLVLQLGVTKRVYTDRLPLHALHHKKEGGRTSLALHWSDDGDGGPVQQEVALFSLVRVALRPTGTDSLKYQACLLRPS